MKLYPFFFLILVSLIVISCNSDEGGDVQLPDDDTSSFYAFEIGNTWNYQYYSRYRPDEDFIPMDYFEENKIVGDTVINGETFSNYALR
ncbi:MAG: hypothetical protein DWP94_14500 [Flavobacterium sp.]|nr:MAG: hypothetical protein DWP94_14500 [Flavobacterium sp.]